MEKRIRELEKEIRKHQNAYYVKNQATITDREFDRLFKELQDLEEAHPELASPDSPTHVVGSDLDNTFDKVEHSIPVLSLANTYSTQEALDWAAKVCEGRKNSKIRLQWKVDGATLVLYYEKGVLKRAVTRGTGKVGDDVTANAKTIRNIPHVLNDEVTLVARGEVFMTFNDFERFNEREGSIYANPRNTASGSMKHKKSKEVSTRPLSFVAFDVYYADEKFKNDDKALKRLTDLGIPSFDENTLVTEAKLGDAIAKYEKKRDAMPMPVDGLVLKLDDLDVREEMGFTAHSPRWAVSLKFEPEIGITTVEEIEVFVGRTGRVTPRARLQPVALAGTTVQYATLHNADFIENLGVRVGATVKVSKRGEIIPAVEEVVDKGKGRKFKYPTKCPVCSTKLEREEDAVDWVCTNLDCSEKLISGLTFYAQRKQMEIVGLGEKIVRTLFDNGYIKNIEDIYALHKRREELEEMEGFGKKSVQVLMDGIEKSKDKPFRFVLPALGLREVGHSVTETLINEDYGSIDAIIKLSKSKNALELLSEIDGIGPKTAEHMVRQFKDKAVLDRIKKLKKIGLKFEAEPDPIDLAAKNLKQIFADTAWCVTGTFETFKPRDLAVAEIKKRGGRQVSSITSKTTHLLAGENAGSKLEKAEKLEVVVVSEKEFLKLIK